MVGGVGCVCGVTRVGVAGDGVAVAWTVCVGGEGDDGSGDLQPGIVNSNNIKKDKMSHILL